MATERLIVAVQEALREGSTMPGPNRRREAERVAEAVAPFITEDRCEHCDDTGSVRVHGAEDYGVSFESELCESCDYGQALVRIDQLEADVAEAEKRGAEQERAEIVTLLRFHQATYMKFGHGRERFAAADLIESLPAVEPERKPT